MGVTAMGEIQTRPWDPAEYLETDEDIAAYLNAALEDGDAGLIIAVLGDISRAKGMAQETGLGVNGPHESQSPNDNLDFATVLKVVNDLGFQLQAATTPSEPSGGSDS